MSVQKTTVPEAITYQAANPTALVYIHEDRAIIYDGDTATAIMAGTGLVIPGQNAGTTGGNGNVNQGTNSATNTGPLVQGAVTTAAPTYTTAKTMPLSLDTAGALRVNITAGGSNGGIVTQATGSNLHTVVDSGVITSITNALPAGTNLLGKTSIDQTTPGTTNKVVLGSEIAQGSTTSGETGILIQGAVTTAAPTYTTAQTSPLSLDTTGALRVNITAGGSNGGIVTQATGSNLHTVVDSGTITAVTAITNALPAGTNLIGKTGIDQTTPGTTNKVSIGTDGTVTVNTLPAGTNLIGKTGIDQTTPGTTNGVVINSGTVTTVSTITTVGAVTAITNALPAGTNLLGKTSIDQTTVGTTDSVTVKASAGIGSLTETAPSTDTGSSGLNGRLQRIAQNITALTSVFGASRVQATSTLVRPTNTTAYAVANVINSTSPGVMTFSSLVTTNGYGAKIIQALLTTNQTACVAQCRLYLYTVAPTAIADTSPFTLLYANAANEAGYIDFPPFITEGSGSTAAIAVWTDGLEFICATNDVNLYGVLVTETIFTPASAQQFSINLIAKP